MRLACRFVPPYIFENIAARGNLRQRQIAFANLTIASEFRGERRAFSNFSSLFAVPPGVKRRTIYDAEYGMTLPGIMVRTEGDPPIEDISANEAYDGTGNVYDFFANVFDRISIDGKGMQLDSTVHYRKLFSNAFWNGQQMVFGDGDGEIFNRFTGYIDIIAHEMTHGITQFESGLRYTGQQGALNESLSDVFGVLTLQYLRNQRADEADWLIGAGLFTNRIQGVAVRSLKEPGTAYDDPLIGKDEQPAHMENYVETTEDNGGVHINSGIPNKAFYNFAISCGGYAWEIAGRIWYVTVIEKLKSNTNFSGFARMTNEVAENLYGKRSKEQNLLAQAWADVGIEIE